MKIEEEEKQQVAKGNNSGIINEKNSTHLLNDNYSHHAKTQPERLANSTKTLEITWENSGRSECCVVAVQ